MSVRDVIVEVIAYGLLAILVSIVCVGLLIGFRIVRSAEPSDRRRYLFAAVMVVGPPIFFTLAARSVAWMHARSGYVAIGPAEGRLIAFFGNLLAAMFCSASAAFVLPGRSPRERGFSTIGGALTGFAIYCMRSAM